MGVMDPHNILAMTRWRRKRRKDGKKKRKSYVKGKVIDGRHELYTLSIAMMLGLRTSIARTHTVISSENKRKALTACDFMAEQKYEFSPKVRSLLIRFLLWKGSQNSFLIVYYVTTAGFSDNPTTQALAYLQIQRLFATSICVPSTYVWYQRI